MGADSIDYKAVIADLKAKRAALDSVIAGLEQWQGFGGDEASPVLGDELRPEPRAESGELRSDSFFGLSIPDAIRKCFRLAKRPLSLSELTNSLKSGGMLTTATNLMATVSATLQRMKQQSGEVVALGKGQWGLAEWYPGLRRDKIEATAKPKKTRKLVSSKRKGPVPPPMDAKANDPKPAEAPLSSSRPTPVQIEEIYKLDSEGKTLGQIAKEVGLHHFSVRHILKSKVAA